VTVLDPMDIDYLLTATRSARKSLDLDAPIDLGDIRDCLRIALQAANGSNSQAWRWLVIADPELRKELAGLYREAYLLRVGGQLVADLMPAGTPEHRLMSSTEWLVENMAKVPLLVIPCYQTYLPHIEGDESFQRATLYGSIFPAVWNFQLALHTRGYGTCVTTLHLHREEPAARGPAGARVQIPARRSATRRRGGQDRPLGWARALEWRRLLSPLFAAHSSGFTAIQSDSL